MKKRVLHFRRIAKLLQLKRYKSAKKDAAATTLLFLLVLRLFARPVAIVFQSIFKLLQLRLGSARKSILATILFCLARFRFVKPVRLRFPISVLLNLIYCPPAKKFPQRSCHVQLVKQLGR